MPTKWEVYEALEEEFRNALPQKAEDLEIGIHEAQCDKFGKEWDKFHEVIYEEFTNTKKGVKK